MTNKIVPPKKYKNILFLGLKYETEFKSVWATSAAFCYHLSPTKKNKTQRNIQKKDIVR